MESIGKYFTKEVDITKKDPELVKKNQDPYFHQFVIDSLPLGIFTVDSELRITDFNPKAVEITGYAKREVLGHCCKKILQSELCRSNCPLKKVINHHNPVVCKETVISTREGKLVPVRISASGLFNGEGHLIGGVETFQDISRLKTLERERANLTSMIAHDMKSPLISIQGFVLRLLKKLGAIDKEEQKHYLNIIKNETVKLEGLINDFLEFSRFQSGRLKLNIYTLSLDKELLALYESYQPQSHNSGIKLEFHNNEQMLLIEADARQLRRVFTNLLDNAFKFSCEGSTITIKAANHDHNIIVEVIDQGIGIDPDDLPYIFDAFHRGKGTGERQGFGIGLAAAKAIVQAHRGKIQVKSEPGKGTAFKIVLPQSTKSLPH
jgi:PAS domain S-box-containing protein